MLKTMRTRTFVFLFSIISLFGVPVFAHASIIWSSAATHPDEVLVYSPTLPRWYEKSGMPSGLLGTWNGNDFTTTASTTAHIWARWNTVSLDCLDVVLRASSGGEPFYGPGITTAKVVGPTGGYTLVRVLATSTVQEYTLPVNPGSTIRHGDELWAFLVPSFSAYGANHWFGSNGLLPYFEICEGSCTNEPSPPPDPCAAPNSCASNVLFLPGIEGSRLYEGTACGKLAEEKLWEPVGDTFLSILRGAGDDKVRDLSLDSSGSSVCSDIYAKEGDIVDTVRGSIIYKSLIGEMNELEADDTINTWKPVAYDWRLSLDALLSKGAQHGEKIFYEEATSTPYIEQTLRALAADSKTNKVTIIAHSNGGLVAKALLSKLGDTEAGKLVDKIIMVGVPQTGAPSDIGAMLVGYDAGIYKYNFPIVSNAAARSFVQNAPMAYHLLPSEDYLESTMGDSAHPIIRFSGNGYAKELAAYGNTIANKVALDDFLLAKEGGRVKPNPSDLKSAEILNPVLINYANSQHAMLDVWIPPAGIKIDQIAGWGVDTVAGVDFYTPPPVSVSAAVDPLRQYRPIFVGDGDGTVPIPSALMMASSTNVKRYWVNLFAYNNETRSGRKHPDLFEIPQLRDFIKNIIQNSTSTLPMYVSTDQPPAETVNKKLTFFLHSPLTLQLQDSAGNITGLAQDDTITQDIPGSTYGEFGEVKYITVPEGSSYQLTMHGQANGTFSLDIQETSGDIIMASSTIAHVPTTASTTVFMDIGPNLSALSPMKIDKNGDGTIDATVTPKLGGTVVFDITPPEIQITFSTTTKSIAFIGTDDSDMGTVTVTATTTYPALKKKQKEYHGIATTTVIARDEAGNTTALVYTERLPSSKGRDTLTLRALAYNEATTTIPSTSLSYKWSVGKNDSYRVFASHLRTASTTIESHYRPKKNTTVIMTKPQELDDAESDDDSDTRPVKQKLPGMVIPYIETEKGSLIISY